MVFTRYTTKTEVLDMTSRTVTKAPIEFVNDGLKVECGGGMLQIKYHHSNCAQTKQYQHLVLSRSLLFLNKAVKKNTYLCFRDTTRVVLTNQRRLVFEMKCTFTPKSIIGYITAYKIFLLKQLHQH